MGGAEIVGVEAGGADVVGVEVGGRGPVPGTSGDNVWRPVRTSSRRRRSSSSLDPTPLARDVVVSVTTTDGGVASETGVALTRDGRRVGPPRPLDPRPRDRRRVGGIVNNKIHKAD